MKILITGNMGYIGPVLYREIRTSLPGAEESFSLSAATLDALNRLRELVRATPLPVVDDPAGRRTFLDRVGEVMDAWRAEAYKGAAGRSPATAPEGLLKGLARDLLPLIDATLKRCRREDGLYDSYNLVDLSHRRADVDRLYPMLEGQVAMLSCGLLSLEESVTLLDTLFESPLFTADRQSFLLYPDRRLADRQQLG